MPLEYSLAPIFLKVLTASSSKRTRKSSEDETQVKFRADAEFGDFIRHRGEDLLSGECLFETGLLLGPAQIACLIFMCQEVPVISKLGIGYVMTGDELRFQGELVGDGQIRSCNGELFESYLSPFCNSLSDYGYVTDDLDQLNQNYRMLRITIFS